jgi:galactokinase
MPDEVKQEAVELFRKHYGVDPTALGVAPGRVELIGNHTDYNGGYILAVALDRCTVVAAGEGKKNRAELVSTQYPTVCNVGRWERNAILPWTDYCVGTLKELYEAETPLEGIQIAVASSVPVGSGLSSSTALEVATAMAALRLFPKEFDRMDLAQLCQRAENRFVGMNCGLLDQFCAVFGAADSALFLDCMTLENRSLPFGVDDIAVIVANSMTKHELVDGEYNRMRQELMDAAAALGKARGREAKLLREISMAEFETHGGVLTESQRKRARHILTDNQRVLDGVAALERGDMGALGRLVFASYASSRDDLMNSCPELDALVELAGEAPGVIGAKLSGGGFGGCTVNLVHRGQAEAFMSHVSEGFEKRFGKKNEIHLCGIGDGARSEDV